MNLVRKGIKNFTSQSYINLKNRLQNELQEFKNIGIYKAERIIESPQESRILHNGKKILNFCSNNYLGLANDIEIKQAAKNALDKFGYGIASRRLVSGTISLHQTLEQKISEFYNCDSTILYPSCWDANGGFFESFITENDAIITDSLNHASIIDGIRLSKAKRFIYNHLSMEDLETKLKLAETQNFKWIVTDGVFSMDGDIAPLDKIVFLAKKYNALIFLDDSHGTGWLGENGKGTAEYFGNGNEIDITTGTLGKALGGAVGGYTAGRKEIIEILRQRSKPYLFSNNLAPPFLGASLKAFELLEKKAEYRKNLKENIKLFRTEMTKAGFEIMGHKDCPICPIFLKDAKLATDFANEMLKENIYVIGFSFPVVPKGQARIRVQLSAAHSTEDIKFAIEAFKNIGKQKGVI